MKESASSFGEFMAQARKAKKLSQVQAAALIGCTTADLSRYENGLTPKLERALTMCRVYGKTPNQMAQAMNPATDK